MAIGTVRKMNVQIRLCQQGGPEVAVGDDVPVVLQADDLAGPMPDHSVKE